VSGKNIFVAATGQNVGKTTTCLGMFAKLQNLDMNAGFIKPVGQRYLDVEECRVDEDSFLIYKTFGLDCELQDMNPVTVPRGFTEKYIDGGHRGWIPKAIRDAYDRISANRSFTLIEGTGHAGVGSVFDASNSHVAKMLDAKVIIVTDGGIGSAIDELTLNKQLFDAQGVEVLGVIVNKVYAEKYDKIADYARRGLERQGMRLLGVFPYEATLKAPTMNQMCQRLDGEFLAGKELGNNQAENIIVGAMAVGNFLRHIRESTLVITPGDREDIILGALSWNLSESSQKNQISGLILTGNQRPAGFVNRVIRKSNVPVFQTRLDSFQTASRVHDMTVKIQVTDQSKIARSQYLFEQYADFDYIMENC
jgi:BioD-like phosphotransacetylase family protein